MHKFLFFFLINLLYSSTCFEHCCAHHHEVILFYTASGIVTRVGGRPTWSDRVPIRLRWRGVAVQVVWPVPEAAGTVFNTPDDGYCDTRNM